MKADPKNFPLIRRTLGQYLQIFAGQAVVTENKTAFPEPPKIKIFVLVLCSHTQMKT